MHKLGFIGTGAITAAFIEGLVTSGKRPEILVSPRSESISSDLARRHANVHRAASNAEVATASEIVFLGMRPNQVEEALDGVTFRTGQTVCSFVTGLSLAELAALAPEARVCRVLPLPAIASNRGPVIHLPEVPEIMQVLEGMGDIVLPETERELVTMGGVSGFMSTFIELENSLANWLSVQGVAQTDARTYVCSMFSGLSDTALRSGVNLKTLADEHETRGGLNERTRKALISGGWFDQATAAIEDVQKLGRTSLK